MQRSPPEEAWADAHAGRILSRRYRLDRLLGVGGMGAVFAATHIAVGRQVAVKILRPALAQDHASVARFHAEARAAAAVARRGVVDVLDFDVDAEVGPFLVMELLRGEPMSARTERAALPVDDAVRIAASILRTLAAVHERGIVHRDLKPANVFLARDDHGSEVVKILDFGICRVEEAGRMTRTGALLGTPGFMAPEQARGERDIDGRTDLYSVGAILYEALGGQPPYDSESPAQAVALLLTEPPRPIATLRKELPAALVGVVETAMAREPGARFATAQAMHDALVAAAVTVPITRELPVVTPPAPPPDRGATRSVRRLLLASATVIALLAVAVVVLAVIVARAGEEDGGGSGPDEPDAVGRTAGPAVAAPAVAAPARSPLMVAFDRAEAARLAGRTDEARALYAEVAGARVAPRTADARAVAYASIALGDLMTAAIVAGPQAPDAESHGVHLEALARGFGEAFRLYQQAVDMEHEDLRARAWLKTGLLNERMADAHQNMQVPVSIARHGSNAADTYERWLRDLALRHLEQAARYHRLAASVSAPGAEGDAVTAQARIALMERRIEDARE